jgi:hypothetical protein
MAQGWQNFCLGESGIAGGFVVILPLIADEADYD